MVAGAEGDEHCFVGFPCTLQNPQIPDISVRRVRVQGLSVGLLHGVARQQVSGVPPRAACRDTYLAPVWVVLPADTRPCALTAQDL
jgi:hypothetical protein